jgi:hypothetical protein
MVVMMLCSSSSSKRTSSRFSPSWERTDASRAGTDENSGCGCSSEFVVEGTSAAASLDAVAVVEAGTAAGAEIDTGVLAT